MSIMIKDLSYIHPDKEILFSHLNLNINPGEKIALTGKNGCGKTTLMQILTGNLAPASGTVICPVHRYYVPQHFGQYDHQTVAEALEADRKLTALHAILNGDASERNFNLLDDDWNIEERIRAALNAWGMGHLPPSQSMNGLSGGEKTRIFLAGMELQKPVTILMDEPTNHLDTAGRQRLYDFIKHTSATVLVISHDRTLLNLLPAVCELSSNGLAYYGGNYDFYREQKNIQQSSLQQQLEDKQKALCLARKTEREVEERRAKQCARGEKASIRKGIPRILMGRLKQRAENSTNKLNSIHAGKAEKLQQEMVAIKSSLSSADRLKTDFNASELHSGKILVTAQHINFRYPGTETDLWPIPLDFQLKSGDRLCITGNNGCGKTTLLKLITGELFPTNGKVERADFTFVYLDQEYSLVCSNLTILEQVDAYNHRHLPEYEVKIILNRYLFPYDTWNKSCSKLSGGEKMRLSFCCLMVSDNTPDIFILDEPTNNMDIESIEIITATIRDYEGTVLPYRTTRNFWKRRVCVQNTG